MARYNEILVGRYNRFLQKALGLKGGPPAPQLSTDISAAIAIEQGLENRYLQSWDRFGHNGVQAAVAAVQSALRYRNPAGSNVVAVFEKIVVISNAATINQVGVQIGPIAADYATSMTPTLARLDARGRPLTGLILTKSGAGPEVDVGFSFSTAFVGAAVGAIPQYDVILTDDQEVPLLPGDALQIVCATVNIAIQSSVMWRERALEEGERA